MTQRHRDKRRSFHAPDALWDAFKRKHGERRASARLRELIAQDLESATAPAGDRGRSADTHETTNAQKG